MTDLKRHKPLLKTTLLFLQTTTRCRQIQTINSTKKAINSSQFQQRQGREFEEDMEVWFHASLVAKGRVDSVRRMSRGAE